MANERTPLGKAWADIGSDVNWTDYGGRWARHIEGTRYHVIRFENCEEWGDGATGYHVDLQEVNINASDETLKSAMQYTRLEEVWHELTQEQRKLALVEELSSYGAYAPLWDEAGTNAWKLIRAAKRQSRLLATNRAEYEARMDRPVNKIGSTAREYAAGDFNSAILRGLAEGRTDAEILAKMGGLKR